MNTDFANNERCEPSKKRRPEESPKALFADELVPYDHKETRNKKHEEVQAASCAALEPRSAAVSQVTSSEHHE